MSVKPIAPLYLPFTAPRSAYLDKIFSQKTSLRGQHKKRAFDATEV